MASFAFVTWNGGGNVPPAIGVAKTLAAKGHHIGFLGYDSQRLLIESNGFEFAAFAQSGQFDPLRVAPDQLESELLKWVFACPGHLLDVPKALSEFGADVVVVDVLMQGALAACACHVRVPVVAFAHSAITAVIPEPYTSTGSAWLSGTNKLRASARLPRIDCLNDAWRDRTTLVTSIRELELATMTHETRTHHVGATAERPPGNLWPMPWGVSDERPLVLVSFSTTGFWDQLGRIRSTLTALAGEPVRILVTAREAADIGALPSNAVASSYAPHHLVLPAAALTITHCGHGTVMASLSHGVPLLGLPNEVADQPFLAKRVHDLGVGLALDGEESPERIKTSVRQILNDVSYSKSAQALAIVVGRYSGAKGAAALLEKMATSASCTNQA